MHCLKDMNMILLAQHCRNHHFSNVPTDTTCPACARVLLSPGVSVVCDGISPDIPVSSAQGSAWVRHFLLQGWQFCTDGFCSVQPGTDTVLSLPQRYGSHNGWPWESRRRKVFKYEQHSGHVISFSALCCCCCCSAGIGRTGVLITMETAMCLIECNQPVYPLDIVRTMRDQRAMMIQTPVSIIPAALGCRTMISWDPVVLDGFLMRLLIIMQRSPLPSVAVTLAPG